MEVSLLDTSIVLGVGDESGIGEARRQARRCAAELGLDEVTAERAAIAASEAARNAVVHGRGGKLLLRGVGPGGDRALEIVAVDRGPGIADIAAAMRDGFSTAGTAGHGLGAMSRIASEFDIWSVEGQGTAVLLRVRSRPGADGLADDGIVSVPMPHETVCGDAWAIERRDGRVLYMVADGLGHGAHAAAAAREAGLAFRREAALSPKQILEAAHAALRPTRGAAVAVAELTVATGEVRFAGIGNVSALVAGRAGTRRLVSLAGTLGHSLRTVQEFRYGWPDEGFLVMHTDGLSTHWELSAYPGILNRHPAIAAGLLFRDYLRGRDDATVLVARRAAP
jgi:anti-sigma regulatory factor (Ser/Thr protein kinase)